MNSGCQKLGPGADQFAGRESRTESQGDVQAIINRANSAKSEATNTTIKLLIKMGRGYRNLDNLIALVYLKCSSLEIPLFNQPSRRTLDPDKEEIGKKIEQAILQEQEQALAKWQKTVTE